MLFQNLDFIHAPGVSLYIGKPGCQKSPRDFKGRHRTDDPGTEAEDVHVVVLDSLMSGIGVMTDRCADADDLVRRNARPDSAPADKDATFRLPRKNGLPEYLRLVGIVGRGGRCTPRSMIVCPSLPSSAPSHCFRSNPA